jgi:hypothetical protein
MATHSTPWALLLLLGGFSPAWAGWETTSVEPNQVVYHDKASRTKDKQFSTMWTMTDFAQARTEEFGKFRSFSSKDVFDCTNKRHAFVIANFFSDKLGRGDVLHTIKNDERYLDWADIAPNTTAEKEWKIACQRAQ